MISNKKPGQPALTPVGLDKKHRNIRSSRFYQKFLPALLLL